jgi:CheY-like chemotaxis protein/HPt (histidine-containing phosphotransfer) domain-containing protein
MNGVLGMTDLLLDTVLDAEQSEYVSIVKSSADALLRVINDILDFSKIEAGKLLIEHIPFDLSQTVAETMKAVALRAKGRDLQLTCEVAPDVPLAVMGDPGRLRQILVNLLGNAIKFTAQGSVAVRVTRESEGVGDAVLHFCVADSGIGIAADKLQSIFEAFSQEDSSTTRRFGGTGLGLSICARLVEAMGGQIWVESEIGHGSAFHFTMRVGLAAAKLQTDRAGTTDRQAGVPGDARSQPQRHFNVLLVEDNAINLRLAVTLLERWGHRVTVAENGQLAVDQVARQVFDVVLMDMMMPVMDGLEATQCIRALPMPGAKVPIIAMTANAMDADRERCIQAGMNDYISKPIKAQELQDLLQSVVGAGLTQAAAAPLPPHAPTDAMQEAAFDYAAGLAAMDQEILEIIGQAFLDQWPQDLAKLRHHLAAHEALPVLHIAHALKGTLAMFGADPASQLAARIETLAGRGDVALTEPLVPMLVAEVANLRLALERCLAGA